MTTATAPHITSGLLVHLIGQTRPSVAKRIAKSGIIETAVYGLGQQGRRHTELMRAYGTPIVAAVHPGYESRVVHESIPVYNSVDDLLAAYPNVAVMSIWKHFATAVDAALEAIDARVPIITLISEGIPLRDAQRIRAAAHRKNVLLFGPNTPGIIFPPERIKAGMLPDVFYPAEPEPGQFSCEGVTIISRSGAILYHMSDALATAGIALNGVLGIGGDAAVATDFVDLVSRVMQCPHTHAVVVAGEIGGCKEEVLAEDMRAHPERYPKPLIALLSGRCAPTGKTMGHAGAIIAPGAVYGTYDAKRNALRGAGAVVVNSQPDLVRAVRKALGNRRYFDPARYRAHMRALWEQAPTPAQWRTSITRVAPNVLEVRGRALDQLIGRHSLLETAVLLFTGAIPDGKRRDALQRIACDAALQPAPKSAVPAKGHISQRLATMLLADPILAESLSAESYNRDAELTQGLVLMGRAVACIAKLLGHSLPKVGDFGRLCCSALAGESADDPGKRRLLEAILVASVDHGVTPPSAQATILAASVRASMVAAVASGICAITHVHGGAGMEAAEFFQAAIRGASTRPMHLTDASSDAVFDQRKAILSAHRNPNRILRAVRTADDAVHDPGTTLRDSAERLIRERMQAGRRIEGLGHRVHTADPRRDPLWRMAEALGLAGPAMALSKELESIVDSVRGVKLPINVDGVIGAIVADLDLPPVTASAAFILGRTAGLVAHYFEEVNTQQPMRHIDFRQAVYRLALDPSSDAQAS